MSPEVELELRLALKPAVEPKDFELEGEMEPYSADKLVGVEVEDPFRDEPRFSDEVLELELEGELVEGKFEELVGEGLDEDGLGKLPVELNEEVDMAEDELVFEDAVLELDGFDELKELLLELPRELDLEEAERE